MRIITYFVSSQTFQNPNEPTIIVRQLTGTSMCLNMKNEDGYHALFMGWRKGFDSFRLDQFTEGTETKHCYNYGAVEQTFNRYTDSRPNDITPNDITPNDTIPNNISPNVTYNVT